MKNLFTLFSIACLLSCHPVYKNFTQLEKQGLGINIKDFGALGDGKTDDSHAFKAAIEFMKKNSNYVNEKHGNAARGLGKLILPEGIYYVKNTIPLIGCNGLILEGQGKEATVIYTDQNISIFKIKQMLNSEFSNLGFYAGALVEVGGKYALKKGSVINSTVFNWEGRGGDRFVKFTNLYIQNFKKVWYISPLGIGTHSEVIYENCFIKDCETVFEVHNSQSINHSFINCHMEGNSGPIFSIYKGGYLNVYGGSYILKNDFLKFQGDNGGLGRFNNHFFFQNIKFEMGHNRYGRVSKIINCVKPVKAIVTFLNVNNLSDASMESEYFFLLGEVELNLNYSQIIGQINQINNGVNVQSNTSRMNTTKW